MVLPFTAITALPSMTPVRVYIQAVRRALRSSGCRFFSTGRLVGSLGRACPWDWPRAEGHGSRAGVTGRSWRVDGIGAGSPRLGRFDTTHRPCGARAPINPPHPPTLPTPDVLPSPLQRESGNETDTDDFHLHGGEQKQVESRDSL